MRYCSTLYSHGSSSEDEDEAAEVVGVGEDGGGDAQDVPDDVELPNLGANVPLKPEAHILLLRGREGFYFLFLAYLNFIKF